MITICCYNIQEQQFNWDTITSHINWDAITSIGTAVIAIFTIILAWGALKQLLDIKRFNQSSEKLGLVQSAENIITKQIDLHYKILERIESDKKDIFFTMYESLRGNYGFVKDAPNTEARINIAYKKLYLEYGNLLGHYYRNLFRIWKKINTIQIEGFDKKYYSKLVRAQLSENEILLLFYNALWVKEYDRGNFKRIIEEYELLEGINYSRLLERDHSQALYSDSAFGTDFN